MTDPQPHPGGGVKLAGHHISPKLLAIAGGVVLLLLFLKMRAGSAASANATGPSTDSALSNAEAAMLSQLQQDNATAIADALAQIPAGAVGPPGPRGPVGKPGPVPPHTVHQPTGHTGSGVPGNTGRFYTVHAGDNLSAIAARYHVSGGYKSLLNGKTDAAIRQHPNLIHPGEKVWIPN